MMESRGRSRALRLAGAVMVAVFFSFALADPLPPKEMGIILGVAVLLDAVLIRLILLPVLAWWRRLTTDETGVFLAIAAGSLLAFQLVWKAQIGVYNDWNLFAIGALVLGALLWRSLALSATGTPRRILAASLAAMAALHSYAWIAANHVHGR